MFINTGCSSKVQVAFVLDVTVHVTEYMATKMHYIFRSVINKLFFLDAHVPVAVMSHSQKTEIYLDLWSNMTKDFIIDMFQEIKFKTSEMFGNDLISKLIKTFYGRDHSDITDVKPSTVGKVVICLGSSEMFKQVPKEQIAMKGLDSIFILLDSTQEARVLHEFVPKYPFITEENIVDIHIDDVVEELMHYLCDS